MPYYPDIEWSIQVCSILGSSPATNFTKMQVFRFLLTNFLLIGFPFLTFWNFVDKKGATLPEVVEVMSNFTTFFHALGKTTVMFFNRRKIKKLFDITKEEFWPLPDYEKTVKSSRMGRNFYFGLSFSFSACAVAKLYIYGESKAGVYRPQWFPQQVFFVMIDIMYIYMTLGFNACDVTIRTILILLTTQFKMLNEELLTMFDSKKDTKVSRKVFKKRFKRCVDHYSLMIDFSKGVCEAFDKAFLVMISASMLSTCASLYIIMGHKNTQQILERVVHIGIVLYAVGYCYSNLGQKLSNEVEDITQSIYLSHWETMVLDHESRDFLLFFTRTQRKYALSAAGFIQFDLDLDMFMVLVKTAISYCMFFRTMEQNSAAKA
ncbi:unnamed protein product [Callosobruchus maculatus]|uniref:Odorant receptor n=1 Tax=Callosobruchus maculatus TaxID=64391 RepID=A0A653DMW2_CALMS|nr:unnamed protein product [Callosobruchus maculatus]